MPMTGASQYSVDTSAIVSFGSANHTTNGSKVIRMDQSYKTGTRMIFTGEEFKNDMLK